MRRKVAIWAFTVLIFIVIAFIWGQSLLPREKSAGESSTIVDILKPIFDPNNKIPRDVFHKYVRKTAHFIEFAALGFALAGRSLCLERRKKGLRLTVPMLCALFVAISDETIQIFSVERGPGVNDVILDFFGALFGIMVMYAIFSVIRRILVDFHHQK